MSQELIHVIDQISKEKGISKENVIEAVESALVSAAKKKYGAQRIAVQIDPKRGDIIMYAYKKVVPAVTNPEEEITLEEAIELYPDAQMDGEVPLQVEFQGFGRIAAQTARQVIVQKVREAERDVILKEFNDKIGQLVNGIVLRHEKGAYYIDLGKTEAVLPAREQVQRESYRRGDRVRAYVLEVRDTSKGPQVVLSRAHPDVVARLFEMEVPEIYENIVEVKGVVREAGDRTKIAVRSKESQVDPVGACVGMKGSRVQAVVRELHGEKIDIIPWSEDPRIFIAKALSPAVVEKVGVTEEDRSALAVVADTQLSLAIGKKGQNVRLAAKLTGWKIDILSESEYDQERQKEREQEIEAAIVEETRKMAEETVAAETMEAEAHAAEAAASDAPAYDDLTTIDGVGHKTAEQLRLAGYDTIEKIAAMSDEEILAVPGIGEKTAQKILLSARAHVGK
ncbi:MAG TPA: transcription termination factor NusA [Nitrospirota bacterium]|nr:transcription termination factor NusA [Nitrospirota bacterium]